MATTLLDDGVGDEDYGTARCEVCDNAIVGNDFVLDTYTYGILCGGCYEAMVEDEHLHAYPPADSDV